MIYDFNSPFPDKLSKLIEEIDQGIAHETGIDAGCLYGPIYKIRTETHYSPSNNIMLMILSRIQQMISRYYE